MAKSRKKSVSQQIVDTAAVGMPGPVKAVAGTKWGSRLVILVAVLAFATGVASLKWENGMPHLSINRERAAEVRESIREEAETIAQKAKNEDHSNPHVGIRLHK